MSQNRPLSECTLLVTFGPRVASMPVSAVATALGLSGEPERKQVDDELIFALAGARQVLLLPIRHAPEARSQARWFVAPDAVGQIFPDGAYEGWERTRDTFIDSLSRLTPHYGNQAITEVHLRFTDLFVAEQPAMLRRIVNWPGLFGGGGPLISDGTAAFNTNVSSPYGGRMSLNSRVRFQLADMVSSGEDPEAAEERRAVGVMQILLSCRLKESLALSNAEELVSVLDVHHAVSKWMFWDSLTPEYRESEEAQSLFDAAERDQYRSHEQPEEAT